MPVSRIVNAAIDEKDFSSSTKKIFSIVLLCFSALLSFLPYAGKSFIFFDVRYSIAPDFISGVVGLSLIIPLYARGILRWSASTYGSIMFFLFVTAYAALAKLALIGGGKVSVYLIIASIVLSWLGMRAVAGFGWILAFAAAVLSALSISDAMGFNGFLFVFTVFFGLIMHSNLSPSRLIDEISAEYSSLGKSSSEKVKAGIDLTRERIR